MASESMYAPQNDQSSSGTGGHDQTDEIPTNPYLTKPLLYVNDLDSNVSDKELASSIFSACLPVRLNIDRSKESEQERLNGTVEFQTLEKAEKAYATIQSPNLSINENSSEDQKPNAKPRLIKQLPHGTEDCDVFDLFRPFGALYSATRIITNPAGQHTGFRGMALVYYYNEEDAQRAQTEMHCVEVEGKTISVTIDTAVRRPSGQQAGTSFSPSAAPFVPSGGSFGSTMNANAPSFQQSMHSPLASPMFGNQSAGSAFNVPGTNLQYSGSGTTLVDPCNLFCKNIDPSIDSNDLFALFKGFGKIVSARVMRDERGSSREFGFVSFRRAEDASRALSTMNGTQQGNKQMIVRLHEPKSVRQEKLSHKFGTSYIPDSPNEHGSGGAGSDANDSPSGIGGDGSESRARRMSNSYFRAAANGENGLVDLDQLQSMNDTLRGDILRGGFSRKVKELEDVSPDQIDGLVSSLSKLRLPEAVGALNDTQQLQQRIAEIRSSQSTIATDATSISSSTLPAGASERDRLLEKVKEILPAGSPVEDIADLLSGLPKKEKAMALFNQDYLRTKVEEARSILELGDDDEGDSKVITSPITAKMKDSTNGNGSASMKSYTLADLAKLPAVEIIQLAGNPQSSGLPLPKADESVMKETDTFIDGLKNLSEQDQKQKLGDQLFKKIRSFGFKGAPKITIHLLDSEDLRSLAHLMNSYPECLREKVALQASK